MNSLVYSYTNLNCYNSICAHQFYRRYIKRDIPFVETPAVKHGNAVHAAMEQRLVGEKPLPAHLRHHEEILTPFKREGLTLHAELKLAIADIDQPVDFWHKDAYLRGKLDCVLMDSNRAFIADWKTGKIRENPFELEVGALLLQINYPNIEYVVGNYVWLTENKIGKKHDLSDTAATWDKVNEIIMRIERDRSWEKRPSGLCGYCDVLDCEYNRKGK
jgi:hypothetical protein